MYLACYVAGLTTALAVGLYLTRHRTLKFVLLVACGVGSLGVLLLIPAV
jgi:hypothetical protein